MFEPIDVKRAYESIVSRIEHTILEGHFQLGDQLPKERDLARIRREQSGDPRSHQQSGGQVDRKSTPRKWYVRQSETRPRHQQILDPTSQTGRGLTS